MPVPDVHDFRALGGESQLPLADQAALRTARASTRVAYAAVRQAKDAALRLAFGLFYDTDWLRGTARAGSFAAFASWEDWWLGDYALYCALRAHHGGLSWPDWPLAVRLPTAGRARGARDALQREILYHQYTQWLADEQWAEAREALGEIRLFGDVPFMVGADSADVWAQPAHVPLRRTVGHAARCLQRHRAGLGPARLQLGGDGARRSPLAATARATNGRLYDGYRVDHLVGFYPHVLAAAGENNSAASSLPTKPSRSGRANRSFSSFRRPDADVTAEDLGLIPDFVRESLRRSACPATRCFAGSANGRSPASRSCRHRNIPPCRS